MDEIFINMNIDTFDAENQLFSNEIIFERVQIWIKQLSEKTNTLVDENWHQIDQLAKILLKDEQVDGEVLDKILKGKGLRQ
jgi:ATP-dependent Zn protease